MCGFSLGFFWGGVFFFFLQFFMICLLAAYINSLFQLKMSFLQEWLLYSGGNRSSVYPVQYEGGLKFD